MRGKERERGKGRERGRELLLCRIQKISGLHALMRLDVLDLHGNQVYTKKRVVCKCVCHSLW